MLLPYRPHTHEMRITVAVAPQSLATSCSPAIFDRPYIDAGFGVSHSSYGRDLRAVEHVVGRQVHEMGARSHCSLGDVAGSRARSRHAPDPGPTRRRPLRSTRRRARRRRASVPRMACKHRVAIDDVERRMVGGNDLVAAALAHLERAPARLGRQPR